MVHIGDIVRHLGYPVGVDVDPQALLAWISARISDKFVYWKAQGWPMHVRFEVAGWKERRGRGPGLGPGGQKQADNETT